VRGDNPAAGSVEGRLSRFLKRLSFPKAGWAKGHVWLFATLTLACVVLLATWMGGWEEGGYLVDDWAPTVFVLAAVALLVSIAGPLGGIKLR
jgi:hypothetical protein